MAVSRHSSSARDEAAHEKMKWQIYEERGYQKRKFRQSAFRRQHRLAAGYRVKMAKMGLQKSALF
jgi:hypothetical protein